MITSYFLLFFNISLTGNNSYKHYYYLFFIVIFKYIYIDFPGLSQLLELSALFYIHYYL